MALFPNFNDKEGEMMHNKNRLHVVQPEETKTEQQIPPQGPMADAWDEFIAAMGKLRSDLKAVEEELNKFKVR